MLQGKKIILGISASIAAFKSIHLLRLLTQQGAEVRVVMTRAALDFVSPLVLSTFSKHPVWIEFHEGNVWNNHVELGFWGDAFIIAPASCNTLGKMANGLCDNIVLATYLSARCPIIIAPAMDEEMYKHPATQGSLDRLRSFGNRVLPVSSGELASGLIGPGRMAEPEEIIQYLIESVFPGDSFKGKKVLVSAGPTQEAIDPVRYISNHSTGKMGVSIAEELYLQGADVCLVAGPLQIYPQYKGIRVISVSTAAEMKSACLLEFFDADLTIMAAAVADYTPISVASEKIKKTTGDMVISLEKTEDILAIMGSLKKPNQILVGFALETENEEANALGKMARKNLDFIILNSLRDAGAGFGTATNQVTIFSAHGRKTLIKLASKGEVAKQLCQSLKV